MTRDARAKKLPVVDDGTMIWVWGKFLSSTKPEEFEALMGRSEAVSEAVTSLLEFSADEKMRIKAEQRELFLMDHCCPDVASANSSNRIYDNELCLFMEEHDLK